MKKFAAVLLILFSIGFAFSEDLKSFMGIEAGASLDEAEKILALKGWKETSSKNLSNKSFEIQKEYAGGSYGNISLPKNLHLQYPDKKEFKLLLYFLKEDDSSKFFMAKLIYVDSCHESAFSIDVDSLPKSIFSDVLTALSTKYDWKLTEGTEKIGNFRYTKKPEIIKYVDKYNSSIIFTRRESRSSFQNYIFRTLNEELVFSFEPLLSEYDMKISEDNQRQQELKNKQFEEEKLQKQKQIDSLKGDL